MNNPGLLGLLGGGQLPGAFGIMGQQPLPMPPGHSEPEVDPAIMLGMGPGNPQPMPQAPQSDPVLEQIAAMVAQQGAPVAQPPMPQVQPHQPITPPQPEQPKQEPPNLLPYEGNRIADEYIARLMMNPAMGPTLGGIAPMPGYDPKQAFANWSASINQPGQPLPHPAYKGPGYGEQLRMDAARAQADESLRSASRI
jgi:hypothetical protein